LFYHGYPSALINLANLMVKRNLKLSYNPICIFLISELFNKEDIIFLKSHFSCQISSFYGHSERLIFAEADDNLEYFTPNPLYGYLELIDENGSIINENNKIGELVATSFDNYAMPLIRYRTGDFSKYKDINNKSFFLITSKWGQMFLFGFNKEKISLTALNLHSDDLNQILKIQFVQSDYGLVDLNVLFNGDVNNNLLHNIENLLSNRVGNIIIFKICSINKLYINSSGKTPLIINKIKNI
jgi:phenylacetate-CoA ligase